MGVKGSDGMRTSKLQSFEGIKVIDLTPICYGSVWSHPWSYHSLSRHSPYSPLRLSTRYVCTPRASMKIAAFVKSKCIQVPLIDQIISAVDHRSIYRLSSDQFYLRPSFYTRGRMQYFPLFLFSWFVLTGHPSVLRFNFNGQCDGPFIPYRPADRTKFIRGWLNAADRTHSMRGMVLYRIKNKKQIHHGTEDRWGDVGSVMM